MINEEEISNKEIRANGDASAEMAKGLNKNTGKIRPINAKYTNDTMRRLVNDCNRMIDDLVSKFAEARQDAEVRMYIRKLQNNPKNIIRKLISSKEEAETFKKIFGVNAYENLTRLTPSIKLVYNSNKRRKDDGAEGSGYIDFSKEINNLLIKYKSFLDRRLVSVYTEEINYFNY